MTNPTARTSALILFLLCFPLFLPAQPLSINGKVVEQNSLTLKGKTALLNEVSLQFYGEKRQTDGNGEFELRLDRGKAPAYVLAEQPYFRLINQEAIERQLACSSESTMSLTVEMGRSQTLNANFSRFHQQLNQLFAQTQRKWFDLFYQEQIDSLTTLTGQKKISWGQLRELIQELESHMEYWAQQLALVNLDHDAADYRRYYQQLRNGELASLGAAMKQLAQTKDLRNSAVKDLLVSWYTATGQLPRAMAILKKNMDSETPEARIWKEYYRLGMLTESFDQVMGMDERLYEAACDDGQQFLAFVDLTELYAAQLDWGKAAGTFEKAQNLWGTSLKEHAGRYEPDYARLLVSMAVLRYQQSEMQQAKTLIEEAIAIYEQLSQDQPLRYEPDLMRSQAVLATFYIAYSDQYAQALRTLKPTLLLAQRLSREHPQVYLIELADMYIWEGSCYQQLKQYEQAIRSFELATRYYDQLAQKNPLKLEQVCTGYFLIAECYNQLLNRTNDPAFKEKGLEATQSGLQKAGVWLRYDTIGAEMMQKNLRYYEDVFRNWR